MAKYIPAWQRTVLTALNNTPWEMLHPAEQQTVYEFILEKNKGDADRAEKLLRETLAMAKSRKALPLGVIILLWGLALVGAPLLTFAFGTLWLAPALALCLVWEVLTAKKTRMRKLWNGRKSGQEGVAEALRAMQTTALRSPLAALDKVRAGVMLVALVLSVALTVLPEVITSDAKELADKAGEITAGQAVMADALTMLPEGLDGLETLQNAMRYTAHGSDEEFLLAALMWMYIENNNLMISDYAVGLAEPELSAVLENTAPAQIDNAEEVAALGLLLRYAGKDKQQAAFTRFLQQKTLPEGMLTAFGAAMQAGRTLPELLALSDEITAAGHDPLAFLKEGVAVASLAEAETLIAREPAHSALLIRTVADDFSQVDDVLAFLRLAKAHGVSAAACYPDGALLTLDTTKWDPYTSERALSLGKRDTFLVLHRREKAEPYTTFPVAEEEQTENYEELPGGLYEDYDPDEADGAAQYTVWLEASVLDRMPQERIPLTFADCDALVILDERYYCDGYVRFSRGVRDTAGNVLRRQIDSPTFGVYQEIAVYKSQSGEWLFSYRENVITSPAMLEEDISSADPKEWNPADNYIAAPDDAWMADAYADFLNALERRNWLLLP